MRATELPRVLVVTREPFNLILGAGITMSNLFGGWPRDRLACVHWVKIEPDLTTCERHYRLEPSELGWRFPLGLLLPPEVERHPADSVTMGRTTGSGHANPLGAAGRRAFRWAVRRVGGLDLARRARLSPDLIRFARQFSPDVIYCCPTTLASIRLVSLLADETRARIVLHVYDDWVSGAGHGGILEPVYGLAARRAFRGLVERADLRMAIGQQMARDYERRYGRCFAAFQNCPEPGPWLAHGRTDWARPDPFVLRFVGALYEDGNIRSLRAFAEAVAQLRAAGHRIVLEVYTTQEAVVRHGDAFRDCEGTALHRTVGDTGVVARLYGTADALLVPYDFDPHARKAFQHSMPTKLPAYMLSGSPLFVYAPADLAVADYVARNGVGHVLTEECTVRTLGERIHAFWVDADLRKRLAMRAREQALAEMSADVVRPAFSEAMAQACLPSRAARDSVPV